MGLMDAPTHWVVGVQREWIRNLYQSLDHFGGSQGRYLRYIHQRWGGCSAVLTPHQRSISGPSAHLWMVLQQSVDHVGLPMWLPGTCDKGSHILLRGPPSLGTEDPPEEQVWETSYGQVLGLRVPRPIFELALRLGVHHLEDLVTEEGLATSGAAACPGGITKPAFKSYRAWVATH